MGCEKVSLKSTIVFRMVLNCNKSFKLIDIKFDIFCFELRMKYNLFTNSDPEDGNAHVRHRTCRFCRTCSRLNILGCPCQSSVGIWESDRFRHKKNTPPLLPTDGKKRKRRKSSRKNTQVIYFFLTF